MRKAVINIQKLHESEISNQSMKSMIHNLITCSGVPSNSLPHDKLNKVSPVKIAPEAGK